MRLIIVSLVFVVFANLQAQENNAQPNIIFIFADDWGYGDLGFTEPILYNQMIGDYRDILPHSYTDIYYDTVLEQQMIRYIQYEYSYRMSTESVFLSRLSSDRVYDHN